MIEDVSLVGCDNVSLGDSEDFVSHDNVSGESENPVGCDTVIERDRGSCRL